MWWGLEKEEIISAPHDQYTPSWTADNDEKLQGRLAMIITGLFQKLKSNLLFAQSCKSGRAFRVGFGPKVDKNFGLNSGLRRAFCLECTKI